jgi:hypothetical protein
MRAFTELGCAALLAVTITQTYASAEPLRELYQASVIVTGEREETRIPAFEQSFALVMAKVSGNSDIAMAPGFKQWAARAKGGLGVDFH